MFIYDIRVQKKALSEHEIKLEPEQNLTSIATNNDNKFLVSNNIGSIAIIDGRNKFAIAKKLNDHMSSISSVSFLASDPSKFVSSSIISFARPLYEHRRH